MKRLLLLIGISISTLIYGQAPTNGLVAYYGFQNSINSHNNIHNLVNDGSTNISYVAGKYGQGASFNGLNQVLRNTSIGFTMTNTAALTIAFWQYKTVNTNYATTFDCFGSAFYRYDPSGSMRAGFSNNNTGWIQFSANGTSTGIWQHIAYVFNNNGMTTNVKIYIDGISQPYIDEYTLNTAWNLYHYHHDITIGAGTNTNGTINNPTYFNGILDEFYVYNRVLSASEIVLVKGDTQGVLSNQNFNSNSLKATVYPNPTSNNFTIEMDSNIKFVEIYSTQGQKVLTSNSKNINVSNLSKGIYLVQIEDENNNRSTQKLIVK